MRTSSWLLIGLLFLFGCATTSTAPTPETANPIVITMNAIDTTFTADSLWIKTTTLMWLYDTSGFSTAYLIISGHSNAMSIGIETHGDGANGVFPVVLNNQNYFIDTVAIGFSHVSGIFIGDDTRIYLYGKNNDTLVIPITNPK